MKFSIQFDWHIGLVVGIVYDKYSDRIVLLLGFFSIELEKVCP